MPRKQNSDENLLLWPNQKNADLRAAAKELFDEPCVSGQTVPLSEYKPNVRQAREMLDDKDFVTQRRVRYEAVQHEEHGPVNYQLDCHSLREDQSQV